jgi:ComF family protein
VGQCRICGAGVNTPHTAQPVPNIVCPDCRHALPAFDHCWTPFIYTHPIDAFLLALKQGGQSQLGRQLGGLMQREWPASLPIPDALIPVPMHPQQYASRGYHVAAQLAKPLAKHLRIPIIHLVRKHSCTQEQKTLNRAQRALNLKNAFEIHPRYHHKNTRTLRHVTIIDDILTTGATCHELALCLKKAGIERVDAWVLCRAYPPTD